MLSFIYFFEVSEVLKFFILGIRPESYISKPRGLYKSAMNV